MTFYGDIDDSLTSDGDSNGSLNLQIPEQHNLLSHDLEVSEASSISAPKMSPLSSVLSLSSESSQDGDEIKERGICRRELVLRPQKKLVHTVKKQVMSGKSVCQVELCEYVKKGRSVYSVNREKGGVTLLPERDIQDSNAQIDQDQLCSLVMEVIPSSCLIFCATKMWCKNVANLLANCFKIVGDTIDKTVHSQHQTTGSPTQSLHYFNSDAVQDRIDLSSYPNTTPTINLETVSMDILLPTEDPQELHSCSAIHIARVLTCHLSSFFC